MKKLLVYMILVFAALPLLADNVPFSTSPYSNFEANGHTWIVSSSSTQWSGSGYVYFMSNYGAYEEVTMSEGSNTFQLNSISMYGPGYSYTVTVKGYLNSSEVYSQDFNVASGSWTTYNVSGSWTGINKVRIINTGNSISVGFDDLNYTPENAAPTNMSLSNSSVNDGDPSGTTVGSFSTTDLFVGGSHTYTFASGGADNGSFTIDGSTLKTAFVADHGSKSSYSIEVRTTDGGGLWYEKTFTVTVNPDAPSKYIVSGAANASYNGDYTATGDFFNGCPVYSQGGSYYLFNMGCTSTWCLANDDPDNWPCPTYATDQSADLPPSSGYGDGGSGGSGSTSITIVDGDASLPVALSMFTAKCAGQAVVIEWTTESETNNLGFILERSADGENWETLATFREDPALRGQGNKSSATEYAYTDSEVSQAATYYYRLSDVSTEGDVNVYASLSITVELLPEATAMDKAYPNPFNPQTYIAYHLAEDTDVKIEVYDILGRKVRTLYSGEQSVGSYHVYWNAVDDLGGQVPTGAYIIRMKTKDQTAVQKVLLMK